jgi:hypothetical protein
VPPDHERLRQVDDALRNVRPSECHAPTYGRSWGSTIDVLVRSARPVPVAQFHVDLAPVGGAVALVSGFLAQVRESFPFVGGVGTLVGGRLPAVSASIPSVGHTLPEPDEAFSLLGSDVALVRLHIAEVGFGRPFLQVNFSLVGYGVALVVGGFAFGH